LTTQGATARTGWMAPKADRPALDALLREAAEALDEDEA
jgi:hypothetical protein